MDGKDLPSSSDESDADFVPKDEEANSDTGSDVTDYETSDGEEVDNKSKKRKKKSKKRCKKARTNEKEEEEKEENEESVTEEKKIDVDALWADFKKDVDSIDTKKTAKSSNEQTDAEKLKSSESPVLVNTSNKPRPVLPARGKPGGLSKILNQIGKKDKMSTLQKSQLDWNNFKKSEGIEEEIKTYNRGKDGYMEKQDFLQRTDLRQFEIEKDLRSTRRKL